MKDENKMEKTKKSEKAARAVKIEETKKTGNGKTGKAGGTGKMGVLEWIVVLIQAVLSGLVLFFVRKILPAKYLGIAAVALVVVLGIVALALYMGARKNRKVLKAFVIILSLIVSVALGVGLVAINNALTTLDSVTQVQYQTHVISLLVKTDSPYEEVSDLSGKTIAVVDGIDDENTQLALDDLKDTEGVSYNVKSYDSMMEAGIALMGGDVESLLINEAYRGLLADNVEGFEDSTKVIYQYEYQEELKVEEKGDFDITQDSFNIVISGIDTYGPVSTVSRSDVNMIVTVNPQTKQILLTSIPRDYHVKLSSFGAYDKLTHAGVFGVEESMNTLADLFGIEIDYYVKVNFTSLVEIVDAVGGITVDNPRAFKSFPAGEIELNGREALTFSRERYSFSGGDNERIKNQQRVLTGLIEKMLSEAIITNYSSVMDAISGAFVTNISSDEIQALLQMQLSDMSSWDIEQQVVTGTGSSSTSCYAMPGYSLYVMKPNYDSVEAATEKINEVLAAIVD